MVGTHGHRFMKTTLHIQAYLAHYQKRMTELRAVLVKFWLHKMKNIKCKNVKAYALEVLC